MKPQDNTGVVSGTSKDKGLACGPVPIRAMFIPGRERWHISVNYHPL
jgi:hypothetical protein